MTRLIITILITFLFSCETEERQVYKESFNYNFVSSILLDGDKVRLYYCSSKGNESEKKDFLIQTVCINTKTNDSLNVLVFSAKNLQESSDNIYTFRKLDTNTINKIREFPKKLLEATKNKIPPSPDLLKELPMVIIDERFKQISENNFPTTIGELVKEN